jgi:hypothetical protein
MTLKDLHRIGTITAMVLKKSAVGSDEYKNLSNELIRLKSEIKNRKSEIE